jgi:hypothetical protein
MTTVEMIAKARTLLDADDDPKWSDTELLAYANDFQSEMNAHLSTQHSAVLLKSENFTADQGAGPYTFDFDVTTGIIPDDDFLCFRELVEKNSEVVIALVNYDDRFDYSTNACYITGDGLYFCESPALTSQYTFTYHRIFGELDLIVNTTMTWLPSIFHIAGVYYMCWKMAQKDKQDTVAYWLDQYEREKVKITQFLSTNENLDRNYEPSM